jgi:NAD+-dependent protein deacetylase sirtuin 2
MEPGEIFKSMEELSGMSEKERSLIFNRKPNIETFISNVKKNKYSKILILAGAGISVSAGIPDFRSPESGLFHNLQKYKLPQPESIFDLHFFRSNPKPFFSLTREIYPSNFEPTPTHRFFQLLDQKDMLLRVYTQNIDTLERQTGMRGDKVIECHGSYATNTCLTCKRKYSQNWFKKQIFQSSDNVDDNVVIPTCLNCNGIVKPDITFYGENLPAQFGRMYKNDVNEADALIVLGTSLQVYPVAGIVDLVKPDIPRILINRDCVHRANYLGKLSKGTFEISTDGFWFGKKELEKHNYRDIFVQGDCDDVIKDICKELKWDEELNKLLNNKTKSDNNTPDNNGNNIKNAETEESVQNNNGKVTQGNGNDLSAMLDNLSLKNE